MRDKKTFAAKQYRHKPLDVQQMKAAPDEEFICWYELAVKSGEAEPNAMCLAAVDRHQQPHARMVLMKTISKQGLTFFTNYRSQKALDIAHNAKVALSFWWPVLHRQVRMTGTAIKLSSKESASYFATRPRSSQVNAIASPQTRKIPSREWLLQRVDAVEVEYATKEIVCPNDWGGYRILIKTYEFWQGLEHRLHDRIYYYQENEHWRKKRLAP